jgi:hypothetical protein
MSARTAEILQEALSMPPAERAELIESILASEGREGTFQAEA